MKFDTDEALRHVKALSSPRRTGSPGEAQAQDYIIKKFKAMGLKPEEEEFSFNPILGLLSKGFLLIVLFLLTTLHFLSPFYPFLRMTLCLSILILSLGFLWGRPIVALLGWALFKEIPFLNKLRSKNIMATWPVEDETPAQPLRGTESRSGPVKAHVYLLAHYDSKSQTFPIGVRVPLVAVLFLSTSFLSAYHLLMPWTALPAHGLSERALFVVAFACGLALMWAKTRNLSPGAIDNASGVAIMLGLAEAITKGGVQSASGGQGSRFNFIATGAEEEGLVGAFWHSKSVGVYGNTPLYLINLDGVGTKGRIYCTGKIGLHLSTQGQKEFLSLIREAAKREGLKVFSPPVVIGAMADHFPFIAKGYNGVTFSSASRRSLWVHSPWDTPEVIETEGMERVGKLILSVLGCLP